MHPVHAFPLTNPSEWRERLLPFIEFLFPADKASCSIALAGGNCLNLSVRDRRRASTASFMEAFLFKFTPVSYRLIRSYVHFSGTSKALCGSSCTCPPYP